MNMRKYFQFIGVRSWPSSSERALSPAVEASSPGTLLNPLVDPEPVEVVNADSDSPLLLVCEHAGQAIPRGLAKLGLSEAALALHIAYDIGAERLARQLAGRFGCRLILQRYSRLVIDCNRPPGSAQSIPAVSDRVAIPGNAALSAEGRRRREAEIFAPYAEACHREAARAGIRYAFSLHSFTPVMQGLPRPWDVGFLYRDRCSRAERLLDLARNLWPEMTIGDKQPYGIDEETDWFIPACAEKRRIPHCLVEVRNDHLPDDDGCRLWADHLYSLMTHFMENVDATDP